MAFKGTGTALVTPFTDTGIDYDGFGRLIDWQIEEGVEFLVVLGTTGESPAVTEAERKALVAFAVKKVEIGRAHV